MSLGCLEFFFSSAPQIGHNFCGCWNRCKKLHKQSKFNSCVLWPFFLFIFQFHYGWQVNRYEQRLGVQSLSPLRCGDCSSARAPGRGEDVSGSPAACVFCKHSTARPHQLFSLTISIPSNFISPPLSVCFFPFLLHASPCWFQMPACG